MISQLIFFGALVGTPFAIIASTLFRPQGIPRESAWVKTAVALSGWLLITGLILVFFVLFAFAHGVDEGGNYTAGLANLTEDRVNIISFGYAALGGLLSLLLWWSFRSH